MTKTPIPEIRASGFIKLTSGESSAILVCENSIKATLSEETRDITPSHIGKAGAVTTGITADIEFTPVKFDDISLLFRFSARKTARRFPTISSRRKSSAKSPRPRGRNLPSRAASGTA